MIENNVGAGILSIITESLYDNPIVVFREYVQNSVDSILRSDNQDNGVIKIWHSKKSLFFLDNGNGIEPSKFYDEMRKIGASSKKRQKNLGYKGIGRLSGVPYCDKLYFINIYDYSLNKAQLYSIDEIVYEQVKNNDNYSSMSFSELMNKIEEYNNEISIDKGFRFFDEINKYDDVLRKTNNGFLVILENISEVLNNTICEDDFFINLQWLLPVDFEKELYDSKQKELFYELTEGTKSHDPYIKFCNIFYNDKQIFRPIKKEMFRDYVCKSNYGYAIGFHSFNGDRIRIDNSNAFTGIRMYIDNMLLCTEDELLRSLDNYGLLSHTLNGQMQSVRGIGAMIYITDKVNISANARRTFIEVTDNDSLEFLRLLAEFVNTIYDTRYSLSNYVSAKVKQESNVEKLEVLKNEALNGLKKLAKEDIELAKEDDKAEFEKMPELDKKKIIKNRISKAVEKKIKLYIKNLKNTDYEQAEQLFFEWLLKEYSK